MFEFCTPELQEKLRVNRLKEEKRMEANLSGGASGAAAAVAAASSDGAGKVGGGAAASAPMETDPVEDDGMDEDEREALRAALAMSVADEPSALAASPALAAAAAPLFDNGLPASFNGLFELHSIVTHKGRSADSGGWAVVRGRMRKSAFLKKLIFAQRTVHRCVFLLPLHSIASSAFRAPCIVVFSCSRYIPLHPLPSVH